MPRYYNSVVRRHQAVRTAGCPLLSAEGGPIARVHAHPKRRLYELYQGGRSAATSLLRDGKYPGLQVPP